MKLLVLAMAVLLSGCAAYRPKAPTAPQVTTSIYDSALAQYAAMPTGPSKAEFKDQIILRARLAMDANYDSFKQSFVVGQAYFQTGVGLSSLGLSLAGGATSSLGTAKILSLITGGITGGYGIYQTNVFANATKWAIVTQMDANRASQRVVLEVDMQPTSTSRQYLT